MTRAANFAVETIFDLTEDQARAVRLRGKDVIVTAGAGSGKTRTLVARYLALLVDGCSPRQLAAITFTEKAAREMRNRVRQELTRQKEQAEAPEEQTFWADLEAQMDSARIGTIHSLCAEILRSHPVEAGIPPEFGVLDEGAAAALRARVVEDTLAGMVNQPCLQPLFAAFEIGTIEKLLGFALSRRLDLLDWRCAQGSLPGGRQLIRHAVERFTGCPETMEIAAELSAMPPDLLVEDAGENLAAQIDQLLLAWQELETALVDGLELEWTRALLALRKQMSLRAGKKDSRAKALLKILQSFFDQRIASWLTEVPDPFVEALAEGAAPQVQMLFDQAISTYQARLSALGVFDFEDLEGGALRLLQNHTVCARWQNEIQALLVDEFQDTNPRQREIIEAICRGHPGRLFVVGDARQSIYRFRGADVTVFSELQARMLAGGGEPIDLDLTFRAHAPLLQATGDLLKHAMACDEKPAPEYWIDFSPLQASRTHAASGTGAPHIELVVGCGEDASSGRRAAGRALASRLLELKAAGQIGQWQDAALLFRASSSFAVYEDALEEAGIPFVTLAGRGFYDRPEIRDVLNLLRAAADPWDDLAVAGLLRSPAFGLTDAAIYRLRFANGVDEKPVPLKTALAVDLGSLSENDRARAARASEFLIHFSGLADRMMVADLLKQMIDWTSYRSILAAVGSRLWRNLDKLVEDARKSRLVQVRDFLEYLQTLRDVGAREGEADVESEGSVQLMTVHKSKGLEFPIVVLADASYSSRGRTEKVYLFAREGLGLKLDRYEAAPLVYRILQQLEQNQGMAEDRRLLYVAATRAREKLIVSGHVRDGRADGWLKLLFEAAGMDLSRASAEPKTWHWIELPCGQQAAMWAELDENRIESEDRKKDGRGTPVFLPDRHLPPGGPLYLPLIVPPPAGAPSIDAPDALDQRPWRATASLHAPAVVVGAMVHRAIQRWSFPDQPGLDRLLETLAFNAGLMEEEQRIQAVRATRKLLHRLREHPIWEEMDQALERHHEVPYARMQHGIVDTGYINLLYRTGEGWVLVDFKTDTLRTEDDLARAIDDYHDQIERYTQAVRGLLGVEPRIVLCFLDYAGRMVVHSG